MQGIKRDGSGKITATAALQNIHYIGAELVIKGGEE